MSVPPGFRLVTLFARLVPEARRAEWREEWRAELLHARDEAGVRGESERRMRWRLRVRAAEAVRDALWLRGAAGGPPRGAWSVRETTRVLWREPAFSLAVVCTLGLGIGAATAIFSVVDGLMLRSLPFRDPERLVQVSIATPNGFTRYADAEAVRGWQAQEGVFEALHAHSARMVTLTRPGEPRVLRAELIEPEFLSTLGVRAAIGRGFLPEEAVPGRDRVVMLSDATWRAAFGADPSVVGATIHFDDEPYTVVGVMPAAVRVLPGGIPEVALPLTDAAARGNQLLLGRIRPELSLAAAQARLDAIASSLQSDQPRDAGWNVELIPLHRRVGEPVRSGLIALAGAVTLLLLVACVNAAGLLFLRGLTRRPEMAVRRALGGSPGALFRQSLAESLLLATLAGALGIVLAWWGVRVLLAVAPEVLIVWSYTTVQLDPRVLLFALGVTLATGIGFGVAPAVRAARVGAMRAGQRNATVSRSELRLRWAIQAVQLALAVMLLAGAGLLARSFLRLNSVDAGFDSENLVVMTYGLPRFRYPDEAQRAAFNSELDARLRSLPGVGGMSWTSGGMTTFVSLHFGRAPETEDGGRPEWDEMTILPFANVDTAWFDVMGVELREGRAFGPEDLVAGTGPVIIDTDLARLLWPGQPAAGRRFRLGEEGEWLTVVGVTGDVKLGGPDDPYGPHMIFYPTSPERLAGAHIVLRATTAPGVLIASVRALVQSLDPGLPVRFQTADELAAWAVAQPRFLLLIMAVFAVMALLLAVVGVYGLVAFTVARRAREFGIRKAIGAQSGQIMADVLRRGLLVTAVGLAIGLLGAVALSRFIRGLLFDTSPLDPIALAAVVLVLAGACTAALVMPARRASRVDAAEALRAE